MADVIIVGGGISGLATTYKIQEFAKKEGLKLNITLIEKESLLGGKIRSVQEDGFLCETGPAAVPDNKLETLQLTKDLGLETLKSNEAAKKRFIFTGEKVRRVPESPGAFLKSDILSPGGKLRIFFEPFTKFSQEKDETIAGFGRRHLGKEAEENLISAMVIGIHAGDSEELSLKSCFPVMHELEKEGGGSLIKAMFKRMKKAKKAKKDAKARVAPSGGLISFEKGIQSLTDAIKDNLEVRILTGKTVKRIQKNDNTGYRLRVDGEKTEIDADVLVLTLPAYSAAKVTLDLGEKLSSLIGGISYVPAVVVCFGYNKEDVPSSLDGFGFLIPKKEGRKILGCRWDSSTFRGRAADGTVLLWNIVGGAINPQLISLNDDEIVELVKAELKDILNISTDPVFIRVFRHEKAIPQYVVGHQERLLEIDNLIEGFPGFFLTGNAFRGIGINDCVKNAELIAGDVIEYLKRTAVS